MTLIHGQTPMPHPPEKGLAEEELNVVDQQEHLTVRDIRKVRLPVTAELGQCPMTVREVLALQPKAVLHLDKLAGEMADIFVCGLPLARGEVVVLGDVLHVRIAEIVGMSEREASEHA